ncbi:MAG: hypothetical protein HFH58_14880 [Lachnospiraceae bacterium]|nr:hypothetical protein [Lachnospiraceae bacterium]
MMAGFLISFIIYVCAAAVMFCIGMVQLTSKKPVGFYSGEKPPSEADLTDVKAWNKKHGAMWVVYGGIILLSYGAGAVVGDTVWCIVPMCGGVVVPIIFMIGYHHRLRERYYRNYSSLGAEK